jgi:hypothetical protein
MAPAPQLSRMCAVPWLASPSPIANRCGLYRPSSEKKQQPKIIGRTQSNVSRGGLKCKSRKAAVVPSNGRKERLLFSHCRPTAMLKVSRGEREKALFSCVRKSAAPGASTGNMERWSFSGVRQPAAPVKRKRGCSPIPFVSGAAPRFGKRAATRQQKQKQKRSGEERSICISAARREWRSFNRRTRSLLARWGR